MADRYEAMTREMLAAHGVRVRRWRASMSGCAWEVRGRDGRVTRMIEAPRPRGPMSAAVFLHEVGHHAVGFHRYSPRCLEELKAWEFALAEMERRGLNVTTGVRRRVEESLRYAVEKALRRGLKRVPTELLAWLGSSDNGPDGASDGGGSALVALQQRSSPRRSPKPVTQG